MTVKRDVFYGRVKGRPLRPQALQAFSDKAYILDSFNDVENFMRKFTKIRFEIGFGGGEHLVARAAEHPQTGFIGAEAFQNGIAKCVLAAQKEGLENLAVWPKDARPLLDFLPVAALEAVYLLYPDPWPKRRHWKRRMVNDEGLQRVARILKPGGHFYFASDWANYTAWALSHALRCPAFSWEANEAKDWKTPFSAWPSTRYEKKAIREGRTPAYLTFLRTDQNY